MPDSYTNLLYHIVFSTKDRQPLITPDHEIRLHEYMGASYVMQAGFRWLSIARKITFTCWRNCGRIEPSQIYSET